MGVLGASRQPMNQAEAADGEPRSKLWAIYRDLLAGGGGGEGCHTHEVHVTSFPPDSVMRLGFAPFQRTV